MDKLIAFDAALVFLLLSHASGGGSGLMESTCRQTPYHDLCMETLRSSRKSAAARDAADLGLVVVDAMAGEAARTLRSIGELMRRDGPEEARRALGRCAEKYDAVLRGDVAEAREALTKGAPKFAEMGAADAALEADSCERDLGWRSPLTQKNRRIHDLSLVAAAIARLLL